MTDDARRLQAYANCMGQIKARIALVDQFLAEWRSQSVATDLACELAALQLRKIYELIAFSAMSADLQKYSAVKGAFARDRNFAEIIARLSKLNPDFLPKPILRVSSQEMGVNWHMEERPEAALSKDDLLYRHGFLGKFLHASNPFGAGNNPSAALLRFDTWVREIAALLSQHRYVVGPNQEGYIIELHGHDEDVTAHYYQVRP